MRRALAALAFAVPLAASAAPFVVGDVSTGTTHTQLQWCTAISGSTCTTWGAWSADTPVMGNLGKHDIAAAVVGTNIVRMRAINVNGWLGREESVPSDPFLFTRTGGVTAPSSLRLSAQ